MSKSSSNQRKKRTLGPPIDLDELYTAPNLRGMLSFLDRPPEEARRRYEEKLAVDRAVAEQAASILPFPAEHDSAGFRATIPSENTQPHDISGSVAPGELQTVAVQRVEEGRNNPSGHGFSSVASIMQPILKSRNIVIDPVVGVSAESAPQNDNVTAEGLRPTVGTNGVVEQKNFARVIGDARPTVRSRPAEEGVSGEDVAYPDPRFRVGNDSHGTSPGHTETSGEFDETETVPLEATDCVEPTVGMSVSGPLESELSRVESEGSNSLEGIAPTVRHSLPVGIKTTGGYLPTVGVDVTPAGAQPTARIEPTDRIVPAVGGILPQPLKNRLSPVTSERSRSTDADPTFCITHTAGHIPTVGAEPPVSNRSAGDHRSLNSSLANPTLGLRPTVAGAKKVKAIRDVQDALTLAGQLLYKAMYGMPDGARSKTCSKGYRQLAAEAHVDKDTVRDLIVDFKEKGIVREIGSYNPDTRASKSYEILSYKAILQLWREAGINHVTSGRRPSFCDSSGKPVAFIPTVGAPPSLSLKPVPVPRIVEPEHRNIPINASGYEPSSVSVATPAPANMRSSEPPNSALSSNPLVVKALNEAFGHVDDDVVWRIVSESRRRASDATDEEIALFVEATTQRLRRMRNLQNPVGMMITQVPKCFEGESFKQHRQAERHRREAYEAQKRLFRLEQQAILHDPASSEDDKNWARQALEDSAR
ncbi:MAG: hypothetical protein QOJ99_410 [Bryobacterales bacterium]|nr:hypothetical protein [Bryobacterales bacterium]